MSEKCRHCGEAVGLYAPGRWLHRPDEAAGRRTPYGLCRTATQAAPSRRPATMNDVLGDDATARFAMDERARAEAAAARKRMRRDALAGEPGDVE